eukprot:NODE_83_length_22684_cov_0.307934.p12 type:complete len:158 gc:universal NODE_83_length_22684_cov_0.307934:803-330(-)
MSRISNQNLSKHDSRFSLKTATIKRVPVDSQSVYTSKTLNSQSEYKSVYFKSEGNLNTFSSRSNLGLYGTGLGESSGRFTGLKNKILKLHLFKNIKNKFLKAEAPQRRIERTNDVKLTRLLHLFPSANQQLLEKSLQMFDNDEKLAIKWCLSQLNKY